MIIFVMNYIVNLDPEDFDESANIEEIYSLNQNDL